NSTSSTVNAYPSTTTTYTITGTTNGCSSNKFIAITVTATPVLTATPTSTLCSGTSLPLTVSGATTYAWAPSTGLTATTGTNVTATPTANITYTITGTTNGCNALKTVVLNVNASPSITSTVTSPSCTQAGAINITVQN